MDVNVLLFADFETLDTFGAVEILGQIKEYRLRYALALHYLLKQIY